MPSPSMASTPKTTEGNYSFFVHSDSTMLSDSPLGIENSSQQKQKRRRTSPRDHAILEAAYLRNSKPDKHERAEIVSQVELGEKEVQIWFQNRRQNDRRKSKPLQPHELLAHFRNGVPVPGVQQIIPGGEAKARSLESGHVLGLELPRPSSRSSSIHELLNPPSSSAESITASGEKLDKTASIDALPTPPSSLEQLGKPNRGIDVNASEQNCPPILKESSHSRKRSHEVMAEGSTTNVSAAYANEPPVQLQPKALTRSSSFVRLAMTVDGAVKVRTNNEPTPSPPKQRQLPPIVPGRKRESFGRSQSAIENGLGFKDINPPIRHPGGAGFGRSRDARTWEFYCDRDSGDTLLAQAEAERSGSAVGAINIIRSRSQRNKNQALSPNLAKQNSRRIRPDQNAAKPKLSRTMSSMARLQSLGSANEPSDLSNKRARHAKSPSGDSDKENWAPGTRLSHHNMRRMHPSAPRDTVLRENDFPTARDPAPGTIAQAPRAKDVVGKEKEKGDDLDCIQGLLSLSQGAWR